MTAKMLKKQETGRSMIEMLGVLAIIGVLSVGGIAGYTTAMRSYKANEIVNATSMLYMMGLASNGGEGNATNLTYTGSIGGSLSALKEITYSGGTLTVEITEDAVCNQVKTKLGGKVTGGDCSAKNSDNNYELTVTLGEASITCEAGQGYNGTECVPMADLYQKGLENWYSGLSDTDCPSGYHLVSLEEFTHDFDCHTTENPNVSFECDVSVGISDNDVYVKDANGDYWNVSSGIVGWKAGGGGGVALCRQD